MTSTAMPPQVDIVVFTDAHAAGATIVDVREPDEFATGHVPGAHPIPLGDLIERLDKISGANPVYVICTSGNRSLKGAAIMIAAGHQAISVAGGTRAWARAGHPITAS